MWHARPNFLRLSGGPSKHGCPFSGVFFAADFDFRNRTSRTGDLGSTNSSCDLRQLINSRRHNNGKLRPEISPKQSHLPLMCISHLIPVALHIRAEHIQLMIPAGQTFDHPPRGIIILCMKGTLLEKCAGSPLYFPTSASSISRSRDALSIDKALFYMTYASLFESAP